jgi:uncharacterized membrane protein HdeD (DUF308 family)
LPSWFLLIGWPISGAMSLTLALLIYFVAEGIFSIMFGLEHQRALAGRWGWLVLNGIIDLFLVGVILFGLPGTAAWVLAAGRHRSSLWRVSADRPVADCP